MDVTCGGLRKVAGDTSGRAPPGSRCSLRADERVPDPTVRVRREGLTREARDQTAQWGGGVRSGVPGSRYATRAGCRTGHVADVRLASRNCRLAGLAIRRAGWGTGVRGGRGGEVSSAGTGNKT
ncbi:hypothetical protein GCM10009836_40690 [Pseudonocardia ailaonensis]|uniref:Uncharacterized protein n=1 Tax=Pseudonocardia ailaonensis TaxID=367279 RepID=A0ABN2NBR8_9PSEU